MKTVLSKYKNPDRFIEKLKSRMRYAQDRWSHYEKLWYNATGQQIVRWSGLTLTQIASGNYFKPCNLDDTVYIVGRITSISATKSGGSKIEFIVEETRLKKESN